MPIFEYMCKKCQKPFEHLALSQTERAVCPSCGSKSLDRLMSAGQVKVNKAYDYSRFSKYMDENAPSCGPEGGDCGAGGCGMGGCGMGGF